MFVIGDIVSYGVDGVCRITEITERSFRDRIVQYYVLKPVYRNTSTLFVPMENAKQSGRMKQIPPASEVLEYIRQCQSNPAVWIEDELQRKSRFKEILTTGNCLELILLVRLLYNHQQTQNSKGKRLHISDEHYLKEAEKLLYEELAVALEIPIDQVPARLKDLLNGSGL